MAASAGGPPKDVSASLRRGGARRLECLAGPRALARRLLLRASRALARLADGVSVAGTLKGGATEATIPAFATVAPRPAEEPKVLRKIFIDGVFDLTHFGHMNAFRQARERGDYLIVGVNSDESVFECKGVRPVLTDSERQASVAACRFVDEILPATPYVMTPEYIEDLVVNCGVHFFVHGDDPCVVNGRDVYEAARNAGRFVTIPRTDGVSTTDIVGRLLLSTKDHHVKVAPGHETINTRSLSETCMSGDVSESCFERDALGSAGSGVSQSGFLVTSRLITAFSAQLVGRRPASSARRVVYVDGSWDMFHAAHADVLMQASELGDFVVVGVHSDDAVNSSAGCNYPIMTMHERLLGVLGCMYVDDVVLNAPLQVSAELIATMNIKVVVSYPGLCYSSNVLGKVHPEASSRGILVNIEPCGTTLTCNEIARRVRDRRQEVMIRHAEKSKKEAAWFKQKHGL